MAKNIPLMCMINWVLKSLIWTGNDVTDIRQIYVIILSVCSQCGSKWRKSLWCDWLISIISIIMVSVLKQRKSVMEVKHRVSRTHCGAVIAWSAHALHVKCFPGLPVREYQCFDLHSHESASRLLIWRACNQPNHRRQTRLRKLCGPVQACEHAGESRDAVNTDYRTLMRQIELSL